MDTLIQTRIDPAIEARVSEVLEAVGLSVSDAVRLLLTRTAAEGTLPFAVTTHDDDHDAWFRTKVREALDDPRPDIGDAEVEAEFGERRRASLAETRKALGSSGRTLARRSAGNLCIHRDRKHEGSGGCRPTELRKRLAS